ncbi:MAG: pyridoxine 5'-phosphate synthase [Alphaproteobacteria bacterium]|jgi:pyridoxine 5-phosphate synthase|nr:pyridoxine 5'-phosphate synthase [Alphaproteobacteria bacterium]MBT5827569.1 pyridoxine 5'-phosphate synthase [Alphaproteobacteria bacterium]
MKKHLRLGVNIDHVATIRNARGGKHPSPLNAALLAEKSGADGITAHLREDRRHISDEDIYALKNSLAVPLNLEMAVTNEMLDIALKTLPNAVCLVPEKRKEITTEGGLNIKNIPHLDKFINKLKKKNIRISLFLEPNIEDVILAKKLEADIIEFHTGKYCNLDIINRESEYDRIVNAITYADKLGIESHAGHGLDYQTTAEIAKISELAELNIGHFLIGESILCGLENAIHKMKEVINKART